MLYYSYALWPGAKPAARWPRAQQSHAAAVLLADMRAQTGLAAGPCSKSHSRALAAAAVAISGSLGVDVELADPARAITALARQLLGRESALSHWDFYRLWTFREAYFKAFGAFPGEALLRCAEQAGRMQPAGYRLGCVQVHHQVIFGAFQLAAVWNGAFGAREINAKG